MALYLNRERMRVVERNERGVVTYRKRYYFGDEVDTSRMVEGREESLLESGALVESKDDLRKRQDGLVPYPGSQVTGAATGEAADHSEIAEDEDPDGQTEFDAPEEEGGDDGEGEDDRDEDDLEMVDSYTDMDYPALQQAAKSRNLNAGGGADDLRARLRADDAS